MTNHQRRINQQRREYIRMRLFVRLEQIAMRHIRRSVEQHDSTAGAAAAALYRFIGAHEHRIYGSGSIARLT